MGKASLYKTVLFYSAVMISAQSVFFSICPSASPCNGFCPRDIAKQYPRNAEQKKNGLPVSKGWTGADGRMRRPGTRPDGSWNPSSAPIPWPGSAVPPDNQTGASKKPIRPNRNISATSNSLLLQENEPIHTKYRLPPES